MDIILRDCGTAGWLGVVESKGKEVYRTWEHHPNSDAALCAVYDWLNEEDAA